MSRAWRRGMAVLGGAVVGTIASAVFTMTGAGIFPYQAPSACAGRPCQAVGVVIVLPNASTLGVQLQGPAPGVEYTAH